MNIDKIYKPLIEQADSDCYRYDSYEVEELEEKYRELLGYIINEIIEDQEMNNDLELGIEYTHKRDIDIIERLTGMKWEDIINDE